MNSLSNKYLAGSVLYITALMVFLVFDLDSPNALHIFESVYKRGAVQFCAYALSFALSAFSIVALLFNQSRSVRVIGLVLVWVVYSVSLSYHQIGGSGVSYYDFSVMIVEQPFVATALANYIPEIGLGITFASLGTFVLQRIISRCQFRLHLGFAFTFPVSLVLVYAILWRTVAMTEAFPVPVKVPATLAYALNSSLPSTARLEVGLATPTEFSVRQLVLIVDESVRGDYLSINGFDRPTTPYLKKNESRFINFGEVSSSYNVSLGSNLVLFSGLKADQLPDRTRLGLTNPSLFQYAKAAGYRTIYIDGQGRGGRIQSHFNPQDLVYIDQLIQVADEPGIERQDIDALIAQNLKALLKSDEKIFVAINKTGAHIDYEDAYPSEHKVFKPTLSKGATIRRASFEERQNSYLNAIKYCVDEFFRILLDGLDLPEAVILYTADHGQTLDFKSESLTHAQVFSPPSAQANVPLMLFSDASILAKISLAGKTNTLDHFHIFPSLLIWMGYKNKEVVDQFGASLFEPDIRKRVFHSGDVFGRGVTQTNEFSLER